MKTSVLFTFYFLLLTFVSGCRIDRYTLEEPLDGRTFEVKSGDRFNVVLDENATTGYVWQAECDDPDISSARETIPPEDGSLCGAPGKVRIVIRVHRGFADTAHVKLVNRRPWKGGGTAREIDFILHRKPEDTVPWK